MYGAPADKTGCGSPTYTGDGGGNGYRSFVQYNDSGTHIAVLLLNRDSVNAADAARRLYRGA